MDDLCLNHWSTAELVSIAHEVPAGVAHEIVQVDRRSGTWPPDRWVHVQTSEEQVRLTAERATYAAIQQAAADAGIRLTTPGGHSFRRKMRRTPGAVLGLLVAIALTAGLGAQVLGWRAVVMRSDSMGDRAPSGSLIIAGPGKGSEVEVGDLLVMRHSDSPTVTHEAIDIHEQDGVRVAITKGARNSQADGTPYRLDGDVLTVRLAIPFAGRVVAGFRAYWMTLVLFMGAALVMTRRTVETSRTVQRMQPLPVSRAVPGI